ncbi:MAG TPA: hypothetical protein VK277_09325 [Acidimicrobiales bacterium]|nr:hypothetical protein [Acidimicrobiales bacterium]
MPHRTTRSRYWLALIACTLGVSLPTIGAGPPGAGAALPPVSGCGFTLGPITPNGAAGTLFFSVLLVPDSPVQRCTVPVTFTTTIAPVSASSGPYTNIDDNPLTAVEPVSFVPGRLQPSLGVGWAAFHCADPAVPGSLTFTVGGQHASIGVTPNSCGPPGSPHSFLEAAPVLTDSEVGIAPTPDDLGYRTVSQSGFVSDFGTAPSLGLTAFSNAPVVSITTDPVGTGAWTAAADGAVFAYGSAPYAGSMGGMPLAAPIVGMVATPTGLGYWLVAADGGVFAFGDAAYDGSMGSVLLNAPVVGMAYHPGGGYWLVASDGGIFSFGTAPFEGSTGGMALNAAISGMAATTDGNGYWLVGSDNGVFAFGTAGFFGSDPGVEA